jgi:hypothetical protein
MKKSAAVAVALGVLSLVVLPACRTTTPEELKEAIELVDLETKWVSKYYQPWPPRLILVPQISFRVKNIGDRPLNYVNFNAVFNFKGERANLGDAFLAAIRGKAIAPGEMSGPIVLKSNLGVDGKDLENIRENPEWKPTEVRLFALSRGSQPVLLGIFDVSREIDFKEPEPVEIKK